VSVLNRRTGVVAAAADGDVVGHGTEGEVNGMQLRLFFSYETFPGVETDRGYRFDPEGGK